MSKWPHSPFTEGDIQDAVRKRDIESLAARVRYSDVFCADEEGSEISDLKHEASMLEDKILRIETWFENHVGENVYDGLLEIGEPRTTHEALEELKKILERDM